MSSWWQVDGEDLRNTDAKSDLPSGGGFEPLPDKTKVLAIVDSAGIGEKGGNRYAEATFSVLKPDGYANRKLFAKYWIFDDNPNCYSQYDSDEEKRAKIKKKRDNDMRRFVKLDAACGGKLAKSGKIPGNDEIALALTGKQVIVQVMLFTPKQGATDSNGNPSEPFNWYADYWPKGTKEISEAVAPKPKPVQSSGGGFADDDLGDDVPFD